VPTPNADFVALSAGGLHSLGLKSNGSIVAWGSNYYGQCNVPLPNAHFLAVADGYTHSLGLKADGSIVAWGTNDYGQCDVPAPNTDFVALAGGSRYSLGLKADGSIVAWGENDYGQCDVPVPNTGFVALVAGYYHGLGLKADGSIVAWGANAYGDCDVPAPNTDFVALAAGLVHSLGLKADGSIVAWGAGGPGQSGYPHFGQSVVPAPNADFVGLAAGEVHSLGLKVACSVGEPELLFREFSDGSWGPGPDLIPGWDHVGLSIDGSILGLVYESHEGYEYGLYRDPLCHTVRTIQEQSGVQAQHSRGSFRHDSTTAASIAGNASVPISPTLAADMESFILTQMGRPYLASCPEPFRLLCYSQQLSPDEQKGRATGRFTCCGLMERAAEEAGLNGGQGFIPNVLESISLPPPLYSIPLLSPVTLYWAASNPFPFFAAVNRWIAGAFDPVDFVVTDPLGRRLGYTSAAGTLNEIPDAFYSGDGQMEQFVILAPLEGTYQVQLIGLGQDAEAAIGGSVEGQFFSGFLAIGEPHMMEIVVQPGCPGDVNGDRSVNLNDLTTLLSHFGAMTGATLADGDLDGNGNVSLSDLTILLAHFGSTCP
jgi:hypothetical protein